MKPDVVTDAIEARSIHRLVKLSLRLVGRGQQNILNGQFPTVKSQFECARVGQAKHLGISIMPGHKADALERVLEINGHLLWRVDQRLSFTPRHRVGQPGA